MHRIGWGADRSPWLAVATGGRWRWYPRGPSACLLGAIEFAQSIERGAAHARLRGLEPSADQASPSAFVNYVGGVQQPMNEGIAVAGLKSAGGAEQFVEPRRARAQRALRCPVPQRRLERGAVLSERVRVNGVCATVASVEFDLEPLRRGPGERIGDHMLVRKE
jgi:hypothetical protein